MSISDRYSCQEHGKKIKQGCVACEVYKDIYELEAERDRLEAELEHENVIADVASGDAMEFKEECDRLKEHIKLLEEDIKSYQADL